MFTGIIRAIGTIDRIEKSSCWRLWIRTESPIPDVGSGDSISVSGVCLTVVSVDGCVFSVDVTSESLDRSKISTFGSGRKVNLETALPFNGKLDGHIVQGHVDGLGKIIRIVKKDRSSEWFIRPEVKSGALLVEKGSVALDGVSLTVASLRASGEFSVVLIPMTLKMTTFGQLRVGNFINIEYDIIGKYVAQHLKFC